MASSSASSTALTVGSGEHLVLCLHGWFGSANGWGLLPEAVDRRAFTYVFFDARGYGSRQTAPGERTIEQFATDAIAVADQRGVDRFSVLGHSMGGKAAAYAQVLAPQRIRSIVGVNPVPPSGAPMDDETWDLFSGAVENEENRKAIIDLTTGNRHTDAWLDRMVQHSVANSDRNAVGDYLESWVKGSFVEKVNQPDTGVLVLAGAADPAMSADVMQQTWMPCYPNAELVTLPEAGHYPMFETPLNLLDQVEPFLSRH